MLEDRELAPAGVTSLLEHWRKGDRDSMDDLITTFYDDLKAIARAYMRGENRGHTLQPTALVNEVYLELIGSEKHLVFNDREHFFKTACMMMRRFLLDYSRIRGARKRGGPFKDTLEESSLFDGVRRLDPEWLLTLEKALNNLERRHPRLARLLELRVFLGFDNQELAKALEISLATVKREWIQAKHRLYLELNRN